MTTHDSAFITAQQAAALWGISDRRVRMLCREGKIPGAIKRGKSYRIPARASKPHDGRKKEGALPAHRYLKWRDDVVGVIDASGAVSFLQPEYNEVAALYTRGKKHWTSEQLAEFFAERIVNRDRRDIERILFRMGLSQYDVFRIAEVTRGMHPKDLLWIAHTEDESFDAAITLVFDSVFHQRIDLVGESVDTPEGYNIKRYGAFGGQYGIYKQRISPLTTDVESEVAVYLLAQKMGIPCCPATRVDKDTVFSTFLYNFSDEYIVHARRLFDGPRSSNEYENLLTVRPQYQDEIARMILLDFVTRQDDRHLSNIAVKMNEQEESFYPLYDNGRSLFYEDTEELVEQAISDPAQYATTFGYSGTYWDHAQEIARERGGLAGLATLDIGKTEISALLKEAGFTGYRLRGAQVWIMKTLKMLKALG